MWNECDETALCAHVSVPQGISPLCTCRKHGSEEINRGRKFSSAEEGGYGGRREGEAGWERNGIPRTCDSVKTNPTTVRSYNALIKKKVL